MKRWRVRVALVAALAVVGAATIGALVATGLGGDSTTRPAGSQNGLRVQPVDDDISCGPGGATVYIYLDDLANRPSTLDATVSAGLIGFEFALWYDPAVLQIGEPINVQLNQQLDREDADRDGVFRAFIPPAIYINDAEGWASMGAASFNPSSQGRPEENREEGLDPVDKGEPILLLTVRFHTVGEGRSSVTIRPGPGGAFQPGEVNLYDPSEQRYDPVAVKEAAITVSGGDCSEVARSTPRPTLEPMSTPFVPPTVEIPTPQLLRPTPAAAVDRPDCPQDWAAYRDPDGHFSLCYPAQWNATTSRPVADFGTVFSLRTAERVSLTVYWEGRSAFYEGVISDRCHAVSQWRDVQEAALSLSGRSVTACVGYETLHAPDAPAPRSTFAEIPLGEGKGYVVVFLTQPEGLDPAAAEDLSTALAVFKVG